MFNPTKNQLCTSYLCNKITALHSDRDSLAKSRVGIVLILCEVKAGNLEPAPTLEKSSPYLHTPVMGYHRERAIHEVQDGLAMLITTSKDTLAAFHPTMQVVLGHIVKESNAFIAKDGNGCQTNAVNCVVLARLCIRAVCAR